MLLAADNLQITNKKIDNAVKKLDPGPIKEMVINCEKAGAELIDINSGPLGNHGSEKMKFLVESVQEVTDLPVIIDTSNPEAMESGLRANTKKAIINGFSMEQEKLKRILPLAKKYKTDIIGYLLYDNSHVPVDCNERCNIALQLFNEAEKAGVRREQIIIDPVLVPVTWQNGKAQAMEVLRTIKLLPELLGFKTKTVVGLSNFTTGQGFKDKRLLLEKAFLPMLISSGLDMALLNIFHQETFMVAKACLMLNNEKIFSWEEL